MELTASSLLGVFLGSHCEIQILSDEHMERRDREQMAFEVKQAAPRGAGRNRRRGLDQVLVCRRALERHKALSNGEFETCRIAN
jgi:hypothetical protein